MVDVEATDMEASANTAATPATDLPVLALGLAQVVVFDADDGTGPLGAQPVPTEQP